MPGARDGAGNRQGAALAEAEGDSVAKGDPLLEIETDKVTVELESPAAGVLRYPSRRGRRRPGRRDDCFVLAAGESVPEPVVSTAGAAPVGVSGNRDPTVAAPRVSRGARSRHRRRGGSRPSAASTWLRFRQWPGWSRRAADLDGSRTVAQSTVSASGG